MAQLLEQRATAGARPAARRQRAVRASSEARSNQQFLIRSTPSRRPAGGRVSIIVPKRSGPQGPVRAHPSSAVLPLIPNGAGRTNWVTVFKTIRSNPAQLGHSSAPVLRRATAGRRVSVIAPNDPGQATRGAERTPHPRAARRPSRAGTLARASHLPTRRQGGEPWISPSTS